MEKNTQKAKKGWNNWLNNKKRGSCSVSLPLSNPDVQIKWEIGSLIQIVYLTPGIQIFGIKWKKKKTVGCLIIFLNILFRSYNFRWKEPMKLYQLKWYYDKNSGILEAVFWTESIDEKAKVRLKDMEEKWCWSSYFIGCHT